MSTLRTNTLQNAAGSKSVPVDTVVDGTAKAWVNFNGTGTVAIRAAFNVSSITDNALGDYTVNFTNAMQDANYAITGHTNYNDSTGQGLLSATNTSTKTASACNVVVRASSSGGANDFTQVSVAIFR